MSAYEKMTVNHLRQSLVDTRVLTGLTLLFSVGALVVPAFLIRNAYTVVLPVATFAGGLLSVYHYSRKSKNRQLHASLEIPETLVYVLWFVVFTAAILLYTASGFTRTLPVNVLLLCLYVLPISAIFIEERTKLVLALLLTTGIIHRGLIYFANPLPYGVDPHYHYGNAHFIAQLGSLEPLQNTKELIAPFYHITGAVGSLLLGLPVRQGTMFLVLVVSITVVTTLIVYHLTAVLWSQQAGLVASTLYLSGDHSAGNLLALGTTELGLLWFAIILYGLLWYIRAESNRYLAVFLTGFFALNFTHHGSMFVTAFSIVTFCFCGLLLVGFTQRLINLSVLSVSLLFLNWMSTSLAGNGEPFLGWILVNLISTIELLWVVEEGVSPEELGFISASLMTGSGYLDVLGMGLLFFFAVFGVLYWTAIRQDYSRPFMVSIGGIISFLLALLLVGSAVGISALVPSRWFKHLYVLLAIPAGVGVIGLVSLIPKKLRTPSTVLACLLILMVPYLVLMGGSLNGSIDDPIFDDAPAAERMSYTDEEVATVEYSMTYATAETDVFSDQFGWSPFRWDRTDSSVRADRIAINLDNGDVIRLPDKTTMVINREYMYSGHAKFDVWTSELGGYPRLAVRGEVPIRQTSFDGYVKTYHAESGRCGETSCGVYVKDEYD